VPGGAWYHADVAWAHNSGLMLGTGAGEFSPNASVTRGMLMTLLHRLAGGPATDAANVFIDVADDAWYSSAIAWAKQNGLANGVGGNQFAPDSEISRQDLSVIIANYAGFANKQIPATLQYQAFADESGIADYARGAVQTLYCGGIVSGKPDHFFDPNGSATRAEIAAILRRFVELAQ
jgi:hypothetical protein